jgi:hypothetical protein
MLIHAALVGPSFPKVQFSAFLIRIFSVTFHHKPLSKREERRLRIFENRGLRRIFGPKREEVVEGWRRLRNEGLHNLYGSPNIIWDIKSRTAWAAHVARMVEMKKAY